MILSLDFAFEGFRILRERPRLLWLWGFVTLFGKGLGAMLLVALGGAPVEGLIHLGESGDVAQAWPLIVRAAPGVLAMQAASLVTAAIVGAAVARAVFGEPDDGLGFLKFGPRELQLIVVLAIVSLFDLAIVGATIGLAVIPALAANALATVWPVCVGFGLAVGGLIALWLNARLMFAVVQSFVERRIAVFDSFALTREPFWTLFGGWLLAWVLALVVMFLGEEVVAAVTSLIFGTAATGRPDLTSLHAFLTLDNMVTFGLIYAFVSPQTLAITLAAPMAAYRAVSGRETLAEAEKAA